MLNLHLFDGAAANADEADPAGAIPVPVPVWRINGHRATITIWTAAEWIALPMPRPPDAQPFPGGLWAALRVE